MTSIPNEKYSIIILTKNEGTIIDNCIKNLPDGVDCYVVDSGSTDNTKEIVVKNSKNYFEHILTPFIISEQRNWALKNLPIKTKWVMFLDADEIIPPELHSTILEQISTNNYNAYRLTPKFIFWGKWMKRLQGFPNWHDRLLKKDEVSIVGGVWETFDDSAKIGYIDIPYNHYANCKGFESWLEKHSRYSSWDADKTFNYLYGDGKIHEKRKVGLRKVAAKLWWMRPWVRAFYMYFIRLGFIEGWQAFYLVMHYFIYEYMIVFKIIEKKRIAKGKSL